MLGARLRSILRWITRRSREERRLSDELQSFVDMAAADYERSGLSREAARRRARLDLGGVEQTRERVRAERHGGGLDAFARDVRLAVRALGHQPGFSLVVIATLAIGIGANTAMFSLIDVLLLRPLPVARPHELVQVFQTVDGEEDESLSYPAVRELNRAGIFRGAAGFSDTGFEYGQPGALRRVRGALVTGAFYDMLQLRPAVGRLLDPRDDEPGAPLAAVISDAFWTSEFGRRPDVLGHTLLLQGRAVPIVGVSPPGFSGVTVGAPADVTVAIAALPQLRPSFAAILGPGVTWLRVLARLPAGASPAAAADRVNAAWSGAADRAASPTWTADRLRAFEHARFRLANGSAGWTSVRSTYRDPLLILTAAVGLLLLIACANVASALLARASQRAREVAVRLALGAGRARVIRQMLMESVLVSLAGAAAGVPLAWGIDRALVGLISSPSSPLVTAIAPDWRVLGFAGAAALVCAAIFGVVPALRATSIDPARGLRDDARTSTSRSALLPALVVTQVALSLVLVAVAGLFMRTLDHLQRHDLGFTPDGVIAVSLGTTAGQFTAAAQLTDTVRAIPGVRAAGIATNTPLDGSAWTIAAGPSGQALDDDENTRFVAVSPGFFEALGMRLIAGRGVSDDDRLGTPLVAVLNDAASREWFADANPVGRRLSLKITGPSGPVTDVDIVGLVRSMTDANVREAPHPTVYVAYAQHGANQPLLLPPTLVARVSGAVEPVQSAVQAAIQAAQPTRIVSVYTLVDQVRGTIVRDRLMATLAAAFGAIALGLAALGLYGLLSYTVARRTREIGIRLALGASERGVLRMVALSACRLVLAGTFVAAPMIWFASRALAAMLFQISPVDPVSLAAALGAIGVAACAAVIVPAVRAMRLDPLMVLRRE